jgi:hypothetical protein
MNVGSLRGAEQERKVEHPRRSWRGHRSHTSGTSCLPSGALAVLGVPSMGQAVNPHLTHALAVEGVTASVRRFRRSGSPVGARWVVWGRRLSARRPGDLPALAFSARGREPSFYLGLCGPLLRSVHQGGIAYPILGDSGPRARPRNPMDTLPCTVRVSGSHGRSTSLLPSALLPPVRIRARLPGRLVPGRRPPRCATPPA